MIKAIGITGTGKVGTGKVGNGKTGNAIAQGRAPNCCDRAERGESHDA